MCSRGRVFGLSVSLSVCLFVHHFFAYSGVLGLFNVSFSSMKMALVIKLTFLRPPFESDHLEAQKACFLVTWMQVKLLALTTNFNIT